MFGKWFVSAMMVCGAALAQPQSSPAAAEWKQHTEAGRAFEAKGHYAEAKAEFQIALRATASAGRDARLFLSRIQLGSVSALMGEYTEAEQWDNDALRLGMDLYGKDGTELAPPYGNLAAVYRDQGDYQRAEEFCRRALRLTVADERSSPAARAQMLGELGGILSRRGKLEEAETSLQQSIEIAKNLPDSEILAGGRSNLAAVYARTGRDAEALGVYQQAYDLYDKVSGRKDPNLFFILAGMAAVQAGSGHYAEAVAKIQSGIELAEAAGATNTMAMRDALTAEAVWLHKLRRDSEAKRARAKAKQVASAASQNSYARFTLDARTMAKGVQRPPE